MDNPKQVRPDSLHGSIRRESCPHTCLNENASTSLHPPAVAATIAVYLLDIHNPTRKCVRTMALDAESQRLRAKQVGMLMRAYRNAYPRPGGARRLSQTGLLDLMAPVDSRYSGRYDHSTVARWESGAIRPTRERLEVFGRALDLSSTEIDGLVSLAGLDADAVTSKTTETQDLVEPDNAEEAGSPGPPERLSPGRVATAGDGNVSSAYAGYAIRYARSRFLLPALGVALVGYFLALLGWNSSFMLAVYVGAAMCVLTAQGFLRLRRSDNDLRELLFVTVFFQLSIHLLHAPLTKMDAYGLYSIGNFAGTSVPFTLSLIANLLVAMVAGLMFHFLYRWQYSDPTAEKGVYGRAAWIVLPPIALVYAFLLAFSNVGFWIVGLGLFTLLAGVFTTLVVLRDGEVSLSGWDRKFLLCTAMAVTIVLSVFGLAAILATYLQPSSYDVSEQGLFYSWAVEFDALGYPADEYFERSRLAVTWASLTTLAYMVIVIGGKLIVTIYRLDGGNSANPAVATAVAPSEAPSQRRKTRRPRVDLRHWPGWITAHRILRLGRNR